MRLRATCKQRSGAHAVEFAVIAPILLFFVLGIIECSMLVFQYQEVGSLAREGARWASVHGFQYQNDHSSTNPLPVTSADDIYNNAIKPHLVMLSSTNVNGSGPLSYSASWTDNRQNTVYYNYSTNQWVQNYVTVTVSYKWSAIGGLFPIGSINLSSTATMPITY